MPDPRGHDPRGHDPRGHDPRRYAHRPPAASSPVPPTTSADSRGLAAAAPPVTVADALMSSFAPLTHTRPQHRPSASSGQPSVGPQARSVETARPLPQPVHRRSSAPPLRAVQGAGASGGQHSAPLARYQAVAAEAPAPAPQPIVSVTGYAPMLARLDKSDVLHGDIIQFAADMRAAAIKRIPVVLSMKTLVTKMLDQTGCCLAPIFDGEIEYGLATPSAVIHADVPVNRKGTLTAIFKCGTGYVRGAYYRVHVCVCVCLARPHVHSVMWCALDTQRKLHDRMVSLADRCGGKLTEFAVEWDTRVLHMTLQLKPQAKRASTEASTSPSKSRLSPTAASHQRSPRSPQPVGTTTTPRMHVRLHFLQYVGGSAASYGWCVDSMG